MIIYDHINSHENLIFPGPGASITEFEGKTLPLPLKASAGLEAACGLRYMGRGAVTLWLVIAPRCVLHELCTLWLFNIAMVNRCITLNN